jgi:hypothetical protein
VVPRDRDEGARRALELAEDAAGELHRFFGPDATVEEVRQAWNRWLELEQSRSEDGGEPSATSRVASELLMAVINAVFAPDTGIRAEPSERTQVRGQAAGGLDAALLGAAEVSREFAEAARDRLVAAQAEVARREGELKRAQVALGNGIRRLHQAGASVSAIAQAMAMSEDVVDRVIGTFVPNEYQPLLACSFCARGSLGRLIAGPGVYICSECVERAQLVGAGVTTDNDGAQLSKAPVDGYECN